MEYVSNCLTEAVQRVTTFAQNAIALVSSLWVDQNNQTDEEAQNSPGAAPRPNAERGIDIQAVITEGRGVAKWVITTSAGCIVSGVSGVIPNEEAVLLREYIFTTFKVLSYASLVSGLALHHLIRKSPETRGFVKIVMFSIYFSQGTLFYAISCAFCLVFPSTFGVVFILVVPPIICALVLSLKL